MCQAGPSKVKHMKRNFLFIQVCEEKFQVCVRKFCGSGIGTREHLWGGIFILGRPVN